MWNICITFLAAATFMYFPNFYAISRVIKQNLQPTRDFVSEFPAMNSFLFELKV